MNKNNFQTALIGCGRIGFLLETDPLRYKPCTHYGGIHANKIDVNFACDLDQERLDKFAAQTNIPSDALYTDYRKLLKKHNPELVIISTWTESHSAIGCEAAKNGAKVIVCEKPIAPSLSSAQKLRQACHDNNVKLIINHERRFDSRYNTVKKLIDENKIGVVKTVNAKILTGPYRGDSKISEGGGTLLHDGTHLIDIIRYFFGEIVSVKGDFAREHNRKHGYEDRALAWLKTANGVNVFLESGGTRKYFIFELEISGSEGKIVIGNGYNYLYLAQPSRYYSGYKDLVEVNFPRMEKSNSFANIYCDVKKHLSGSPVHFPSTGLDGYKALEAIHAIYLSSYKNGKELSLPLKQSSINLKKIFNLK